MAESDFSKKITTAKKQLREILNPEFKSPLNQEDPVVYRIERLKTLVDSIQSSQSALKKQVTQLEAGLQALLEAIDEKEHSAVDKNKPADAKSSDASQSKEE